MMLPESYQKTLQKSLTTTQFLILGLLLNVLQSERQAKLERLVHVFPSLILASSRRRKLQRFLSLPQLTLTQIGYPFITYWLTTYCLAGQTLSIVIDRSQWGGINLLMIGLVWERRAIPLRWSLLPKLGNSNLTEQKEAITEILSLLQDYQVVVLGDREFCSVELASWLREKGLSLLKKKGSQKYVSRSKEPSRKYPRRSSFGSGLDSEQWLSNLEKYAQEVQQLMILTPHKRLFYQRGMKAVAQILSSS